MVKISIIVYLYNFVILLSFLVTKTQEQYNEIISFESTYPNSLTLNNGNILIVAQKGIYLYNQLNHNITIIKEFPSDLYISTENIATKTTFLQLPEKDGGYIIIFANDILYGLSPDANSITTFGKTNETDARYYSLSFFKIDQDNNIFYTFGYCDSSGKYRLSYYKLNIGLNLNDLIYSKDHESTNSLGNLETNFNSGISCERMNHISLGKLLVCFHENRINTGEISNSIVNPENNFEIISSIPSIYITIPFYSIVIKTATSNNYKKTFVCYLLNAGVGSYCFFYNIDDNTYTEPIEYSTYCKPNSFSLRTYFFPQTNKFLFVCGDQIEIIFILFNEEDNKLFLSAEKKNVQNCYSYQSLSVSFSSNDLNYIMIIDAECSTGMKSRIFSIEHIKNVTIFSPPYESIPTSKFYSSSLSSLNISYSILSDDKLTSIPLISNPISDNMKYTSSSLYSTSLQTSSLSSTSLSTSLLSSTLLQTSSLSSASLPTSSLSSTLLQTSSLSSASLPTSLLSSTLLQTSSLSSTSLQIFSLSSTLLQTTSLLHSSSFSSTYTQFPTISSSSFSSVILHSNSISSFSNTMSISINKNSNFITSSIKDSDLSSIFNSSSLIANNSILKCDKYLNYERNKCIESIPLGFYLYDKAKGLIEKCHKSCNSCIIGPDEFSNNCNQCKNNSYYLENGNCIINFLCPNEKPLFNIIINECVEICSVEELLKRKCIINRVSDDSLQIINENIRQIIYNLTMNDTIDIIIEGNNIIYQISTTTIAKKNKNDNISSLDLGGCENKIKEEYKIDYIIIQKSDINYNNMTIVQYELYNPNNKEEEINLKLCKGDSIQVYTPLDITNNYIHNYYKLYDQGYNILNQNDSFYNDICTQFTSDYNTDMNLFDRKTEYYIADLTSCEIGCSYKQINMEKRNIQCECPIKFEEKNKISDFKISQDYIINSFYKFNEYSNFKVIKCYKLVFSIKGQLNNIGSYFLIIIILLYILCGIRYYSNNKIYMANLIKLVLRSINSGSIILFHKSNPLKRNLCLQEKKISKKKKGIKSIFTIKKQKKVKKESSNYSLIGKNKLKNIKSANESDIKIISFKNKRNIQSNFFRTSSRSNKIKNNNYNDEELNTLEYEEAIIIDKRGYLEYYFSLLRQNNLVLFTFFQKNDYNLPIVKYSLFLISLSLYFVINSFFFIDSTIHKIYEYQGMIKLFLELPRIIYSSIVSVICNLIVKSLALSEKNLLKLKKIKDRYKRDNSSVYLYIFLRRKIAIYFIIGYIFLIYFWYFISAFCAVYKNTQVIYLNNCSISFCISMLYPFFLSLIPGLFRIPSLRSGKNRILYKIGNIFSLL